MDSIGGTAVDVPVAALSGFDAQLGAELQRWLTAEPGNAPDGFTLAWLVTARIRAVGRHQLWEPLLNSLAEIRHRHQGHDAYLDAFLDAVLARHQGRFDNDSYLAQPLLRLIAADRASNLDPVRLSALLLADVLRHEHLPESGLRLDAATRSHRIQQAAWFVAETDATLGTAVPSPPGTVAGEWLSLTTLPVSTAHDEYLLIRVMQAHELVFDTLTGLVEDATIAVRIGQIDRAAVMLRRADHVFRRAVALFQLLVSIRRADFEQLGEFVTGIDVTRPDAHRRFEAACADLYSCSVGEDLGDLAGSTVALEASHQNWNAAQAALATSLRLSEPTPAPAPVHPVPEPLMTRANAPVKVRKVSPITVRALAPTPIRTVGSTPPRPTATLVRAAIDTHIDTDTHTDTGTGTATAAPARPVVEAAPVRPIEPAPVESAPVRPMEPAPVRPGEATPTAPTVPGTDGAYVRRCADNRQFASDTLRLAFGR